MNAGDLIAALDLPVGTRVDQRVPKKLFVENGAPTATDKRRITDGVEDVQWVAALKPTTVGVPEFRDPVREYVEIAVLNVTLRLSAQADRLAGLIHRAVPYPMFLIATHGDRLSVSMAHKRWSQGEVGATVVDGELVAADLGVGDETGHTREFATALPIGHQPRANLFTLYQGWMDTVLALLAARVSGRFATTGSPERASARREALAECVLLEEQMVRLRVTAAKERQVARQVDMNLELNRLQAAHAAARARL
jgi:hypothetical protein